MSEPALSRDPDSGQPVRRVISGGYGLMLKGDAGDASAGECANGSCATTPPSHSCGSGCGCFPG